MKAHLRPCPACGRHVRTSETGCPFCRADLPDSFRGVAPPALPTQRLGRAALFAFGLLGAPACTDEATETPSDASASGGGGTSHAGGSGGLASSGGADGGASDARPDEGSAMPLYGLPSPDAANTTPDSSAGTEGGPVALYGAPSLRPDAADGPGGGVALYGAPPPKAT